MPIVIDQFDIQPAAGATAPSRSGPGEKGGDDTPPSEQHKEMDLARLLAARHERSARLRAY